ncbi:MAG: hypothetical protein AAB215_04580 [Planctomycetota bacterium]
MRPFKRLFSALALLLSFLSCAGREANVPPPGGEAMLVRADAFARIEGDRARVETRIAWEAPEGRFEMALPETNALSDLKAVRGEVRLARKGASSIAIGAGPGLLEAIVRHDVSVSARGSARVVRIPGFDAPDGTLQILLPGKNLLVRTSPDRPFEAIDEAGGTRLRFPAPGESQSILWCPAGREDDALLPADVSERSVWRVGPDSLRVETNLEIRPRGFFPFAIRIRPPALLEPVSIEGARMTREAGGMLRLALVAPADVARVSIVLEGPLPSGAFEAAALGGGVPLAWSAILGIAPEAGMEVRETSVREAGALEPGSLAAAFGGDASVRAGFRTSLGAIRLEAGRRKPSIRGSIRTRFAFERGEAEVRAFARVRIGGRARTTLAFRIPAGLDIRSVQGEGLAAWRVAGVRLEAEVTPGVDGENALEIEGLARVPEGSAFALPILSMAEGEEDAGKAEVVLPPGLSAVLAPGSAAEPLPSALPGGPALSFRTAPGAPPIPLLVSAPSPRVRAEVFANVRPDDAGIRIRALVRLDVRASALPSFRIPLPAGITAASVTGARVRDFGISPDGRRLWVDLAEGSIGGIEAALDLSGPAPANRTLVLGALVPEGLDAGTFAASLDPGRDAEPVEAAGTKYAQSVDPRDAPLALASLGSMASAWVSDRPDARIAMGWRPVESRFSAVSWTVARASPGGLSVRSEIALRASRGRPRRILVRLPAGARNADVTGPDVRAVRVDGAVATVDLAGFGPSISLEARFAIPARAGERSRLSPPELLGAVSTDAFIGIAPDGRSFEVRAESVPEGFSTLSPEDVPARLLALLGEVPIAAFRAGPLPAPEGLSIAAETRSRAAGTRAVLRRAEAYTILRPGGFALHGLRVRTETRGRSSLSFRIPPERFLGAYVDGAGVRATIEPDGFIRVPLPVEDKVSVVEALWTAPANLALGLAGRVCLEPPEIRTVYQGRPDDPAAAELESVDWDLRLPEDWRLWSMKGPFVPSAETPAGGLPFLPPAFARQGARVAKSGWQTLPAPVRTGAAAAVHVLLWLALAAVAGGLLIRIGLWAWAAAIRARTRAVLRSSLRTNAFRQEPRRALSYVVQAFVLVGIVAMFAAVAIPSLLRSKITANESSAIASLKTLVTAQEQYKSTSGSATYATLEQLSATTPQYVDSVLGEGKKSGYRFILVVGTPADSNWYAHAIPISSAKTGNRAFFVDSSGVIRFSMDTSPPALLAGAGAAVAAGPSPGAEASEDGEAAGDEIASADLGTGAMGSAGAVAEARPTEGPVERGRAAGALPIAIRFPAARTVSYRFSLANPGAARLEASFVSARASLAAQAGAAVALLFLAAVLARFFRARSRRGAASVRRGVSSRS